MDIELSKDCRDFFGILTFSSSTNNSGSIFTGVGVSLFIGVATGDGVGVFGRATSQTEIACGKSNIKSSFFTAAAREARSSCVHFSP